MERDIINTIRLKASEYGVVLWRNNIGVAMDGYGRAVRYGLANESSRLNSVIKSSDLIGITPVFINEQMVGKQLGVFTAIEVKLPGWCYNPNNDREVAQNRFIEIIKRKGGIAFFSTGLNI